MTIEPDVIETLLEKACSVEQWQWYKDRKQLLTENNTDNDKLMKDLLLALAIARRKMGVQPLAGGDASAQLARWSCADGARVLLMLKALAQLDVADTIKKAYERGDEYEREAILKGLPILDSQGVLVDLAIEACRTNIVTLFTAISQANPYPAEHFDQHSFNQMVLKSLFLDLNIEHIAQLKEHLNPSLSRMCYDYLCEKLAAGRVPPVSIWLAINLDWTPEAQREFITFLGDEDDLQRLYVAISLSWQSVPQAVNEAIDIRIHEEPNRRIRALLANIF